MKRVRFFLLAALLSLNVFILFHKGIIPARPAPAPADKPFSLLETVLHLIKNDYIEEKNPLETMEGALRGLVNSLDPLSGYLNRRSTSLYLEQQKERQLYDVGILLMKRYGFFPMVVGVLTDSPAQRADIRIGDYITEINELPTAPMSLIEARLLLRSKQKTPVTLKILREEQTRTLTVERALLSNHPYSFQSQPGTNGWLQVRSFSPPLVKEFTQNIAPLLKNSPNPFIIDLRMSQEGSLEEALKFLNLFLKSEKIGYFQGRTGNQEVLSCPQNPLLPDLSLVVWTSLATQDLGELVAAVLQEGRKARVVGQETPGLVAKREFFLLRDGTSFFLTAAIASLQSNKTLWGKGVEPDVKLRLEENETSHYLRKTLISQTGS